MLQPNDHRIAKPVTFCGQDPASLQRSDPEDQQDQTDTIDWHLLTRRFHLAQHRDALPAVAMAATGKLMKKIQCQLQLSLMAPPDDRPDRRSQNGGHCP